MTRNERPCNDSKKASRVVNVLGTIIIIVGHVLKILNVAWIIVIK